MKTSIRSFRRRDRRGVTLAELLVVLAILSLLATLAVPVYVSRAEQARRAVARSEVRTIAEAQEIVGSLYGYLVPIHTLDKVPDDTVAVDADNWTDYPGTAYFIRVGQSINDQSGNQLTYAGGSITASNEDLRTLIENWQGPFLNPAREYRDSGASNPSDFTAQDIHFDLVLDPWGRPYRLFTSEGITGTANTSADHGSIPASPETIDNGFINIQSGSDEGKFDKFAIVSFGPDGELDANAAPSPDDIYYEFGTVPNPNGFGNL